MKFSLHSSSLTWWLYTCIKGRNPQWSAALNRGRGLRWRRSGAAEPLWDNWKSFSSVSRSSSWLRGGVDAAQVCCGEDRADHEADLSPVVMTSVEWIMDTNNRNELLVSRVRLFLRDRVEEPLRWVRQEQDALRSLFTLWICNILFT